MLSGDCVFLFFVGSGGGERRFLFSVFVSALVFLKLFLAFLMSFFEQKERKGSSGCFFSSFV